MEYVRKWFTFEGKRYSVYGKTERDAYLKMVEKQRELEKGRTVVSNSMTVEEWAVQCVDAYKTRQKEVTRKAYMDRMRVCVFKYIGRRPLKDVSKLDLIKVLNYQQGNSDYQIRVVRQMLMFIFGKAKEHKLIAENPAENLPLPSGKTTHRRQMTATEEQYFLQVCAQENRFIVFLLMYYCGCRPVEARNALGSDISEIDGWHVLHIRGEKTINADRYVPIPDALFERIKNVAPDEPIAKTIRGYKYTDSSFLKAFNALRRQMNIAMGCKVYRNQLIEPLPLAEDFVPYSLRHTYCCNLKKAEIDVRNAKYLMGHSDIRLTANIYTHTDTDDIVLAAKQIRAYEDTKSSAVSSAPYSTI